MPARKHVAPELIAEGKYLYEETLTPTDEIGKKMGLSRSAFYLRVKEWNWTQRRYSGGMTAATAVPSVPADAGQTNTVPEPPLPFAEQLRRVIDAQMRVAERTLKVLGPASSAEAERTARVLALVSRTVQEITATAQGRMPADETNNDSVPRDMDVFRETLALRIRSFIDDEQREAGADNGETAQGDDGPGP